MIKAARQMFTNCQFSGCNFHLAQALLEAGQDCQALREAGEADTAGHHINEVAVVAAMIRQKVSQSCDPR